MGDEAPSRSGLTVGTGVLSCPVFGASPSTTATPMKRTRPLSGNPASAFLSLRHSERSVSMREKPIRTACRQIRGTAARVVAPAYKKRPAERAARFLRLLLRSQNCYSVFGRGWEWAGNGLATRPAIPPPEPQSHHCCTLVGRPGQGSEVIAPAFTLGVCSRRDLCLGSPESHIRTALTKHASSTCSPTDSRQLSQSGRAKNPENTVWPVPAPAPDPPLLPGSSSPPRATWHASIKALQR